MKIEINFQRKKRLGLKTINEVLCDFREKTKNIEGKKIERFLIDFSSVEEIHPIVLILIWNLAEDCKKLPCKNKQIITNPRLKEWLNKMHFFDGLTRKKNSRIDKDVPFHCETFNVDLSEKEDLNTVINKLSENSTKHILEKGNQFHEGILIHIQELLNNAFDHSRSKKEVACLSTLNKKSNLLDFCVCDRGQGIRKSFLSNPQLKEKFQKLSDVESILEATEKNISCNPNSAKNPSYKRRNAGFGFYDLRKFVEFHKNSQLVIFSGEGLISIEGNGKMRRHHIASPWNGTVVYFRTRLDQQKNIAYEKVNKEFLENLEESLYQIEFN